MKAKLIFDLNKEEEKELFVAATTDVLHRYQGAVSEICLFMKQYTKHGLPEGVPNKITDKYHWTPDGLAMHIRERISEILSEWEIEQ
jgi:hypothetical protein